MAIRYGKGQIKTMVEAIDQDHDSAEDAALAALEAAEKVLEERAKYVIVGKLAATKEKPFMKRNDPESIMVALGFYSTPGDAQGAAESLWHSTSTGDEFRTAVLPVFYGSPAEFHQTQKEKYQKEEEKRAEKQKEKLRKSIEDQRERMLERARGEGGVCDTCGHQPFDHRSGTLPRKSCLIARCKCEAFVERKKKK